MSKNILIAIPTLNSGGVEVSLIRFLNELSKNNNVKIDLLMLDKTGIYLKDVPKNINIMKVKYTNSMYDYNNKLEDIKNYKNIFAKLKYLKLRMKLRNYINKNDWVSYYKEILPYVESIPKNYDLAIDWHGYGHFITTIVAEKVNAKKKAMWLHDEKNDWLDKISYWQDKFDKIFCVGLSVMNNAIKNKPELKNKLEVFYNMIDYQSIIEKSKMSTDIKFDKNTTNIVTVGRLEWQKAYDVAINIAAELKKQNFKFCWYVIGGGAKEQELKKLVSEKQLENEFIFLGIIKNPFPIVKMADLYVLSSRHEGYCIATLEAKILNKVIIATDIDSNKEQIVNNENGFLCKLDPKEFANKIIEVSNNKKLITKVKQNLSKESYDNTSEFNKLYKLMEE